MEYCIEGMKDKFTSDDVGTRIDVSSNDGDATSMFNSDANSFEDGSTGKLLLLPIYSNHKTLQYI